MKLLTRLIKILLLSIGLLAVFIVSFYGFSDIPVNKLKVKYAQPPSSFISINGLDVHYRDEGILADTLPIVLIHGTGSSLHTFNEWSAVLKNEYRVVRMDLPAFGLTGPFPNRDYSIENYVVFIEQFLSSKGIKRCILSGNSLGGEIAWRFTVKNPEVVEKLILIDATGYPNEAKSQPIAFTIARTPILNKLMTFITPRFVVQASLENVYVDKTKVTDALVDRYFELTLREGNRQALVDRMMLGMATSPFHLIKNIQQPTLVLWGEQDLLIPIKNARRFHKDLPNGSLAILKNVGHVPMEESPNESLATLLAFLKK
ncbi:MAG: pimeloyl-ACP methyl ester carboxylesterase [Cyclobacteriaceae bacterium]|jgi:pimeloyl-ACP methyl ester carboxylesterase